MKHLLLRSSCCLAAVTGASIARADLNPAVVGNNARWVAYADVDALRQTAVGRELITALERLQPASASTPIRLDLPKVVALIGNLTAYGSKFDKDPARVDGTLIVRGQPQLRRIVEALLVQASVAKPEFVSEVKDLGVSAYALSAPGDKTAPQVVVALPSDSLLVISRSREQLVRSLKLAQGGGDSLADATDSPLRPLLHNADDAVVFAASAIPSDGPWGENAPQARILRMAQSGSVALGQTADKTFARVRLIASSDEMADKLVKILQGMTAMMSLAESSDNDLNAFLNSAVATREGDTVSFNLNYSSDRLAQMAHGLVSPPPAAHNRHFSAAERPSVAAVWVTVPGPDGKMPPAEWKRAENVALVNGSTIMVGEVGSGVQFDRLRIFPKEAPPSSPAPWLYRRSTMSEAGFRDIGRIREATFPGEDGTYTIEVHVTAEEPHMSKVSLRVKNPAPVAPPPAADSAPAGSGDNNR